MHYEADAVALGHRPSQHVLPGDRGILPYHDLVSVVRLTYRVVFQLHLQAGDQIAYRRFCSLVLVNVALFQSVEAAPGDRIVDNLTQMIVA